MNLVCQNEIWLLKYFFFLQFAMLRTLLKAFIYKEKVELFRIHHKSLFNKSQ